MKQRALDFLKHPLVSGSSIIFVGTLSANFLNFLFNIFMTRNLSIADYGTVTSLISIIMMPALISSSVIPTVINFGATYFAKDDISMVRGLYIKITKPLIFMGLLILLFFIFFSNQIGSFFHIEDMRLLWIAGVTIFITFIGAANGALLQAKLAFKFIAGINLLASVVKVAAGVFLIVLGYQAFGVMLAVFLAFAAPFVVSYYPLKFIFNRSIHTPKIDTISLFKYGAPSALTAFSVTSLITTDIIMVKHFFTPENAGLYAVLSLIGRVIFFLTAPIGQVMFPLIVQKYTKNENYKSIFFMAIILVLIPAIGISIFYFLFPEFTIQFFNKQEKSLQVAPLLGFFGLMISIYAVVSILTNFFLSIKKTNVVYPLVMSAIMQVVFISIFHETFMQVITINMVIVSLLLFVLLLYYIKLSRGEKKT